MRHLFWKERTLDSYLDPHEEIRSTSKDNDIGKYKRRYEFFFVTPFFSVWLKMHMYTVITKSKLMGTMYKDIFVTINGEERADLWKHQFLYNVEIILVVIQTRLQ